MKFKGTKLTGSSILTVLGVVCFATILVAAAFITSGFIQIGSTTVTEPGTVALTAVSSPTTVYRGDDSVYTFTVNPQDEMVTGAILTVKITKADIALEDVTSIVFNDGSDHDLKVSEALGSGVVTYSYTFTAPIASGLDTWTVTVVYGTSDVDPYIVTAELKGDIVG